MQVLILCGGKGTRSYPFTMHFPKPMMPICGTPILVHIMRLFAHQGFVDFTLAAGHRKEVLDDYFDGRFPNWRIRIVDTGQDTDTGERIRRCEPYLDGTFFATYGDGVGDVRLHDLLEFHRQSGGLATVTSVPLRSQYGAVAFDSAGKVLQFKEKPIVRDHWINAGFFVFDKPVFELWKGKNLEREVLPALAGHGVLFTYRHESFWKSMDTSKDQEELEKLCLDGGAPWVLDNTEPVDGNGNGRRHGAADR